MPRLRGTRPARPPARRRARRSRASAVTWVRMVSKITDLPGLEAAGHWSYRSELGMATLNLVLIMGRIASRAAARLASRRRRRPGRARLGAKRVSGRLGRASQTDLWSNRFVVKQICGRTELWVNQICSQICSQTALWSNIFAVKQICGQTQVSDSDSRPSDASPSARRHDQDVTAKSRRRAVT